MCYKALVKVEKLNFITDAEQFFGARKLWTKLSREHDVITDIIDTNKCEITTKML